MSGMFRTSSSGTNTFNRFIEIRCVKDYYEVQKEIEQNISEFYRRKHKHFCNECNQIKKDITGKNKKIQHCYSISRFPKIESTEIIREFINECPDIPECRNPIVQSSKKPIITRYPKTDSCKGNVGCKENVAAPVAQKGKPPPELAAKTSKAKIPEVKGSLEQDRVQLGEKVNSHTQSYPKPSSSSVGAHDEGSKLIIKQLPVNPEPILTPTQPLSVSSLPPSSELDFPKNEQLAPSAVICDSDSSSSPQVEGLIKDTPAVIHPVGRAESANQFQNVSVDGQNAHSLASDKVAVEEDFSGRNLGASLPGVEGANNCVTNDGGAHDKDIAEADTPRDILNSINNERGTEGEVSSSKDDQGKDSVASTSTSTLSVVENREGVSIETAPLHEDQTQEKTLSQRSKSLHGVPTNKEQELGAFISDNTYGGTVSRNTNDFPEFSSTEVRTTTENGMELGELSVIDLIENYKKYIISGLLPLVIFLLLFLLIKCTPMGTLFTKKKERKRKEMNEKLQRVLSEPSAKREGRIPFSYSAFEYST